MVAKLEPGDEFPAEWDATDSFMDPRLVPWVQVSQVYWMSQRLFHRRLSPHKISASQARVLAVLYCSSRPMKVTEISALLFQESQAATAMVHRLEARGWIRREPDLSDRRSVRLELTGTGRELAAAISEVAGAVYEDMFAGAMSAKESHQLLAALRKVRQHAFDLPETGLSLRAAQKYAIWRD